MAGKVKTAVEIAQERAAKGLQDRDDGRVEIDFDNVTITPQEKTPSHVLKQEEVTGFDIDKKGTLFKDDKQTFSRIRDVRAEGHMVWIEVDEGRMDENHAAVLVSKKVTPEEALERAIALNRMLMHKAIKVADTKQVEDIVEATITAVLEAQENGMRASGCTREDIKRTRKARLDRINQFEAAVAKTRGPKELSKLQDMLLFKKVLQKVGT